MRGREGGILGLLEIEQKTTKIILSTNFLFQIFHIFQCHIVPIYVHFKDDFGEFFTAVCLYKAIEYSQLTIHNCECNALLCAQFMDNSMSLL